jgi:neutral trehalase
MLSRLWPGAADASRAFAAMELLLSSSMQAEGIITCKLRRGNFWDEKSGWIVEILALPETHISEARCGAPLSRLGQT